MRLIALPLIAAALAAFSPAQAEVVQASDAGFVVREVAEVPADSWATWAALTSPAKWWSAEHTWSGKAENLYLDSQATGCFCELMPVPDGAPEGTRRGSVEHMHIVQSNPGKVLRMKGALGPLQGEAADGVLTITLKTTPKGMRLLWEYVVGGYMRMKPDQIAPAVDKMLGAQLASLARLLGGGLSEEAPKMEAAPVSPAAEPAPAEPAPPAADAPKAEGDLGAQVDAAMAGAAAKPAIKPAIKPRPKAPTKPVAKKPAAP